MEDVPPSTPPPPPLPLTLPSRWALSTQLLVAAILYLGYWLTLPTPRVNTAATYPLVKVQSALWPSNSRSVSIYDLGLPQFEEPANTAAPGTSAEHLGEVVRRPRPHSQFLDEASPSHRSEGKRKKTKTVAFAIPDSGLEDLDGDIEMIDAVQEGDASDLGVSCGSHFSREIGISVCLRKL